MELTEKEKQNLALYDRVCEVPKEAQKNFDTGSFKGTDINPMWRIKTLTREFGACGKGWYYEIVDRWTEQGDAGKVCVFVTANLYVKFDDEWSKPIQGTGGNMLINKFKSGYKTSDEAFKMALTDALSIACKALGIGADIWWKEDKTKYTDKNEEQQATQPVGVNVKNAGLGKPDLERQTMLERIQIMVEEQNKQEWLKGIIGDNPLENYGTDSIRKIYKQLGGK